MREQFGLAPNTLDTYARSIESYLTFPSDARPHFRRTDLRRTGSFWPASRRVRALQQSMPARTRGGTVQCFRSPEG